MDGTASGPFSIMGFGISGVEFLPYFTDDGVFREAMD